MDIETLRTYCLSKPETTEDMPFGDTVLAIRLLGKIFALISLDDVPTRINLKCDPERTAELRERYASVIASYYHGKWNTIEMEGDIPASEIRSLIDLSYELVAAGLPKKMRASLKRT